LKKNNKDQLNIHNVELSKKSKEMKLKTNEQIDKSKLNDQEILIHSLEEKNEIFEIKTKLLSEKIDALNQNISELKNTIIKKEDEHDVY
jgi:hypothetical protein